MAAGLLLLGAGWVLGGSPTFSIGPDGLKTPSDYEPVIQKKTKIDSYDKIIMNVSDADILIVPSEDENYYIEYTLYNNHKKPMYSVKDKTLTLKDSLHNRINFLVMGFTVQNSYVKLYMPEAPEFKKVSVSTDDGNIKWNVPCDTGAFEISNSYGNTFVTGVKGSSLKLDASDGNVDLSDCIFKDADIGNSYGNVDLKDIAVNGEKGLNVSMSDGNLKMTRLNAAHLNLINSYGNIQGSDIVGNFLAFDLSDGELRLKKADIKEIHGENEYGNINLNMTDSDDLYDFALHSEYGNIRVNNSSHDTEYSDQNDRPNKIEVSSTDGNIKITTAK